MNRHELLARLKELEATVTQREMTMAEGWKQAAETRARVAELEGLLAASERERVCAEGALDAVCLSVGGLVEGRPPGRHNVLQRVREMAKSEDIACMLENHAKDSARFASDAERRIVELEGLLDAVWQATGVASTVRGLAPLDDVIATQRRDLLEALTERDAFRARAERAEDLSSGLAGAVFRAEAADRELNDLKARLDALIDFCSCAEDGDIINGRAFKHAIAAAKGEVKG